MSDIDEQHDPEAIIATEGDELTEAELEQVQGATGSQQVNPGAGAAASGSAKAAIAAGQI
ncbi:hypothetical protein [Candidatus Poriferisodalis sp.]|uniref:hypothetical protein n=1 Tax=Candidatus Poriferisodalis sp. TaxID=3101277 RepID=UPI003B58FF90